MGSMGLYFQKISIKLPYTKNSYFSDSKIPDKIKNFDVAYHGKVQIKFLGTRNQLI